MVVSQASRRVCPCAYVLLSSSSLDLWECIYEELPIYKLQMRDAVSYIVGDVSLDSAGHAKFIGDHVGNKTLAPAFHEE